MQVRSITTQTLNTARQPAGIATNVPYLSSAEMASQDSIQFGRKRKKFLKNALLLPAAALFFNSCGMSDAELEAKYFKKQEKYWHEYVRMINMVNNNKGDLNYLMETNSPYVNGFYVKPRTVGSTAIDAEPTYTLEHGENEEDGIVIENGKEKVLTPADLTDKKP